MDASAADKMNGEINPAVELLNQTCLGLVAQIEILQRENALLKKKERAQKGRIPLYRLRSRKLPGDS